MPRGVASEGQGDIATDGGPRPKCSLCRSVRGQLGSDLLKNFNAFHTKFSAVQDLRRPAGRYGLDRVTTRFP